MSPTGSVNTICGPGPLGHLGWHQNLCWEPGMLLLGSGAGLGVAEPEQEEGTGTGNSLMARKEGSGNDCGSGWGLRSLQPKPSQDPVTVSGLRGDIALSSGAAAASKAPGFLPSPQRSREAAGAGILCRERPQPLRGSGNSSAVTHPSPVWESSARLGLAQEGAASWNSLLEQGSLERTGRSLPSVSPRHGGKCVGNVAQKRGRVPLGAARKGVGAVPAPPVPGTGLGSHPQ